MGAWDYEPWKSDEGADWFYKFFNGIDWDARMTAAFRIDDEYDQVRAACYILQVLGRIYVWPGDIDKLGSHLDRGIDYLTRMLDPENPMCQELQEMWGADSPVFASISTQLEELKKRRSEGSW